MSKIGCQDEVEIDYKRENIDGSESGIEEGDKGREEE
jgi:hypothetical protein